ncbi:MAG: hypothetical protein U1F29_12250 [Planctomycetota bacterium]
MKTEPMRVLRQVKDVMQDPAPDPSWMSEPRAPSAYWAWLKGARAAGE